MLQRSNDCPRPVLAQLTPRAPLSPPGQPSRQPSGI